MSKKTIIIIRHAHRVKIDGGRADNGLSRKGKRQARAATRFFFKRLKDPKPLFVSSPKKRCVETLEPIANKLSLEIRIDDLLNEQQTKETLQSVAKRAQAFHRWWLKKAPRLTVISSHGDWIPLYLEHVTGAKIELRKGGWAELEAEGSAVRLTWLAEPSEIF